MEYLVVMGGQDCPKCGAGSLFRTEDGWFCEDCLTAFNHDGKEVSSQGFSKYPLIPNRQDKPLVWKK